MALQDLYEEIEVIEIINTSDGLGGFIEAINVVKTIHGTITRASNKEMRVAEKLSNKSYYSLYTSRESGIKANDLIRRVSDNRGFRITSLPGDRKTPAGAGLNIEKFECEIYEKK